MPVSSAPKTSLIHITFCTATRFCGLISPIVIPKDLATCRKTRVDWIVLDTCSPLDFQPSLEGLVPSYRGCRKQVVIILVGRGDSCSNVESNYEEQQDKAQTQSSCDHD